MSEQTPTEFPYVEEGTDVMRGRIRASGTGSVDRPIPHGKATVILGVGAITEVSHKPFEGVMSRGHAWQAEEMFVVPLADVAEALDRARRRQAEIDQAVETELKRRNGEEQLPLDDERIGMGKPDLDAYERTIRERAGALEGDPGPCPNCEGSGEVDGAVCPLCGGEGTDQPYEDGEETEDDGEEPDAVEVLEELEESEQLTDDELAAFAAAITPGRYEALQVVAEVGPAKVGNRTARAVRSVHWQAGGWLRDRSLVRHVAGPGSEIEITPEGRQLLAHLAVTGREEAAE